MSEANIISKKINELLPKVKTGMLRFFGEWFGRPYDNQHKIVAAFAIDNALTTTFNGDDQLTVWNPNNYKISELEFEIKTATRMLWRWYYYGREIKRENERFQDFEVDGQRIRTNHNIEWYEPNFQLIIAEPAVRIYSFLENPTLESVHS